VRPCAAAAGRSQPWEASLSPSEIAKAVRWRLASDIETELASQGRVAERIAALRSRLESQPEDWILSAAMAFEVERWYAAVESLLVQILRTLEGDAPMGPAHHREVLRVASLAKMLRNLPALHSPALHAASPQPPAPLRRGNGLWITFSRNSGPGALLNVCSTR
jgi:hypothetical protein